MPSADSGIAAKPTESTTVSATNQPCGRSAGRAASRARTGATRMTARSSSRARDSGRAGSPGRHLPPGRARGTLARRASRRSTSSRVPPPRQAITGQPSAPSPASTWSRSSRRIRQARSASCGSTPSGTRGLAPGGRVSTTTTGSPRWTRLAVAVTMVAPSIGENTKTTLPPRTRSWSRSAIPSGSSPARTPASRSKQHPQVAGAGAVPEQPTVPADDAQADPVAGADVVLGDRGRGPHALVEAAGLAVEAAGVAVVAERVDDEEDAAVLLGRRGGDVQLAAADRDPPADPAQPVAGAERPDVGELDAGPEPRRAVDADQADRPRGLGPGVEPARVRQHPQPVAVQADRPPAVAGPRRWSGRPAPRPAPAGPTGAARSRSWAGRRRGRRPAPVGGCSATYGVGAITRATCSTSSSSRITSREVVPWPSCSQRWSSWASSTGDESGRCSSPKPASRTNGAPSTITAGAEPTTAATTATAPTTTARASAGVGRQREVTSTSPRSHRCSSVVGVGTWTSTASTMERPVVCVIQSSGRTVTRCESTVRATAFTSSGMT